MMSDLPSGPTPPSADRSAAAAAEEIARAWVVRLASGSMDAEGLAQLADWRAEHPAHEEAFVSARTLWQQAGHYESAFRSAAPRRNRRRVRQVAALLVAASLLLGLLMPAPWRDALWGPQYRAGATGPARFTLEDGTVALLDAGSAMDFSQSDGVRRVDLRRGTAFFEVAHDTAHPFKVHAGSGIATAVGTAFAVRRDGSDAIISVTQGRVHVESGGRANILPAGVEDGWSEGTLRRPMAFDLRRRLAWRTGRIILEGRPLAAALREIGRYHDRYILLLNNAAADRRVSGVFSTAQSGTAIEVLARTQNLRVTRLPWLTILS